jgi:hypothetical protein
VTYAVKRLICQKTCQDIQKASMVRLCFPVQNVRKKIIETTSLKNTVANARYRANTAPVPIFHWSKYDAMRCTRMHHHVVE